VAATEAVNQQHRSTAIVLACRSVFVEDDLIAVRQLQVTPRRVGEPRPAA
jgi:hypothetical protein